MDMEEDGEREDLPIASFTSHAISWCEDAPEKITFLASVCQLRERSTLSRERPKGGWGQINNPLGQTGR